MESRTKAQCQMLLINWLTEVTKDSILRRTGLFMSTDWDWPKLQCVGTIGAAEPGSIRARRSASSRLASTRIAALSAVQVRLRSVRSRTAL